MLKRFHWKSSEITFLSTGMTILVVATLVFGIKLMAQGVAPQLPVPVAITVQQPSNPPFLTTTTEDPWFWIMVAAWMLSCLVSGMPEPEKGNSPAYIWMYRTLHLIVAQGTSYFQHKYMWATEDQMKAMAVASAAANPANRHPGEEL